MARFHREFQGKTIRIHNLTRTFQHLGHFLNEREMEAKHLRVWQASCFSDGLWLELMDPETGFNFGDYTESNQTRFSAKTVHTFLADGVWEIVK